jgi:sulfite reductase (ferredoxin)
VFDLIEVDLESAREALTAGRLLEATILAARALLVTRGEQANNETEVLELFSRLFLNKGLVEPSFGVLVGMAKAAVKTAQAADALDASDVAKFLARIENLYANMGTSLRFAPAPQEPVAQPAVAAAVSPADREADFRGVVCPLNYVKTKMLLGPMKSGSVVSVLLDEAGSHNVPASVEKDGHEVLSVEQEQGYWRVRIRKG